MKSLWVSIFFCFYSIILFPQGYHSKTQQLVDTTSSALCRCFNTTFDSIDVEVRELIQAVFINPDSGQQKIQDYLKHISEERTAEVIPQFQKLGSMDSELAVCLDRVTTIFQHLPCGIEELSLDDQLIVMKDFENEEKTIDLLMQSLALRKECEFAYQFIKLGLELQKK